LVCLVGLVCLVCLVCLVGLVCLPGEVHPSIDTRNLTGQAARTSGQITNCLRPSGPVFWDLVSKAHGWVKKVIQRSEKWVVQRSRWRNLSSYNQ